MDNPDFIIVGLGNPGKKYAETRHNAGFLAIEAILKTSEEDPISKKEKGVEALSFSLGKFKILALRPLEKMNKSGEALKKFLDYKNISQADFIQKTILICDDSDLAEGKIKISQNRGTGGHKGLENIFANFGAKDFTRIRIGIRPFRNKLPAETFVLAPFKEDGKIGKTIQKIPKVMTCLIKKGLGNCQSLYNSK